VNERSTLIARPRSVQKLRRPCGPRGSCGKSRHRKGHVRPLRRIAGRGRRRSVPRPADCARGRSTHGGATPPPRLPAGRPIRSERARHPRRGGLQRDHKGSLRDLAWKPSLEASGLWRAAEEARNLSDAFRKPKGLNYRQMGV
jgi:hypothetical protein